MRNDLTETYVNYAVPLQSKIQAKRDDKMVTVSVAEFVNLAKAGQYKQLNPLEKREGPGGFHGIVLVPEPAGLERTPPYVEEVIPNSPAAKAGIKPDDLVVYVNGEQIGSIKKFREIVDRAPPGTEVQLEVRRGESVHGVVQDDEPRTKTATPKTPRFFSPLRGRGGEVGAQTLTPYPLPRSGARGAREVTREDSPMFMRPT
jgi:serine protease Do